MAPKPRQRVFLCTFAGVVASFGLTIGYAWYLRSPGHRRELEAEISEFVGMPVGFDRLAPLSFHAQAFEGVQARLWDTGPKVFACDRATWVEQLVGDEVGYHLHLRNGWLIVGTPEWRRYEYERLIAAGLQHDFADLGLQRVRLEDFDLRWVQDEFELRAERASGVIDFTRDGEGSAQLTCGAMNGQTVDEPIAISARFTSGAALDFHQVQLAIPRSTLDAFNLDDALGGPVCAGEFSGDVRFTQTEGKPRWSFRGSLFDADLAELTRRLPGGPYAGTANLTVDRAEIEQRRLEALELTGELVGILIGQIWPGLDPDREARTDLVVREARFVAGSVELLSVAGRIYGLDVQRATDLWGQGRVTGVAEVTIHSLIVLDDRLHVADVEVHVRPPQGEPGLIDRRTLALAAKELLGVDLAVMLPEQVEYAEFGARLKLDGDQLRVLGTHGADGRTLLTIRLFGRDVGLVRQPDRTFTVPDPMAWLRTRAMRYDAEDVRSWWKTGRFAAPADSSAAEE